MKIMWKSTLAAIVFGVLSTLAVTLPPQWAHAQTPKPTVPVTFLRDAAPGVEDGPAFVTVRGRVYEDSNGNNVFDEGEPMLKGVGIGIEMGVMALGDTQHSTTVIATTDTQGQFTLNAPRTAIVTLMLPEGFRATGSVSRYANEQLAFGLRAERVTVERVIAAPPVYNIQPPLTLETIWPFIAIACATVLIVSMLVARAIQTQTRASAEIADWLAEVSLPRISAGHNMNWLNGPAQANRMIPPPPGPAPNRNGNSKPSALLHPKRAGDLSTAAAVAIRPVPPQTTHYTNGHTRANTIVLAEDESIWYALAEQAIADAIHESMILDTFLGLGPLPKAWIKFASRDGRTVTFALTRTGIPGCWWGIGRCIDPLVSRRVYADLRRVYEHFALLNHQPSRLPRNCTWYLFAERMSAPPRLWKSSLY